MALAAPRIDAPVICVGNFVAGGAGKTPAALAIAEKLLRVGRRVAFLSRGYGGRAQAVPLKVDVHAHSARDVGDEPLLLARVAPCYVFPDRLASAQEAVSDGANVLVMDDGLQNASLAKDLRFAVVDAGSAFGNGLCVPAGPLRAPVAAQAEFVDALILLERDNGEEGDLTDLPRRPTFRARLAPDAGAAATLIARPVLAFAGIATPQKFFQTLRGVGAQLTHAKSFPDHHPYTERELEALLAQAQAERLKIVTTEKDAMRIPAAYLREIAVLPVALRFDDEAGVAALLSKALKR
jgi:tetraacyldisaccharide 4'-kinase